MVSNFFGLGGYGTASTFFDTFFGGSAGGNSMSSLTSSLGDLNMIRTGAYKKLLSSYYETQKTDAKTDSTDDTKKDTDSNKSLSNVKSAANAVKESAAVLQKTNFEKVDRKDLLEDVKDFVSDYNSLLNSTKKLNNLSMLQTAVWATEKINTSESLLNKVGISVGYDNTLSVDEDKFSKASASDLKTLFSGSNSLAAQISQKASTLANQSANQLATNSGSYMYNMYGTLL